LAYEVTLKYNSQDEEYNHPFVDVIMNTTFPLSWKPPIIEWYNGSTNPDEHIKV